MPLRSHSKRPQSKYGIYAVSEANVQELIYTEPSISGQHYCIVRFHFTDPRDKGMAMYVKQFISRNLSIPLYDFERRVQFKDYLQNVIYIRLQQLQFVLKHSTPLLMKTCAKCPYIILGIIVDRKGKQTTLYLIHFALRKRESAVGNVNYRASDGGMLLAGIPYYYATAPTQCLFHALLCHTDVDPITTYQSRDVSALHCL